jgi:hypothetical protein
MIPNALKKIVFSKKVQQNFPCMKEGRAAPLNSKAVENTASDRSHRFQRIYHNNLIPWIALDQMQVLLFTQALPFCSCEYLPYDDWERANLISDYGTGILRENGHVGYPLEKRIR